MNWFLIALVPPAMWAASNLFDKYLLSNYFKGGGVGALMVFSSLVGFFLLPTVYFFHPEVLHNFNFRFLLISLNGFFYVLAILPYFYALMQEETTIAVALFQLSPVIYFILAYFFLGETLKSNQILGGFVVILGAILISLNLKNLRKIIFKKEVFGLMLLSNLLFSLNFIFFKFFALEYSFWVTSFWEYVGFSFFAVLLLVFVKSYRSEFLAVMRKNGLAVLLLNGVNEIINILGKFAFNYASLLKPIALTDIVTGLQPLFIFIYGIILTVFFPKISKEDISRRVITQRLVAITIIFLGIYLINQ